MSRALDTNTDVLLRAKIIEADNPDLLGPGCTHPDGELTILHNSLTTFNSSL